MKKAALACMAIGLLLSGCGGGDGGVNSTPPPPTTPPPPPLPLTATSTFQTGVTKLAYKGQVQTFQNGLPVGGNATLDSTSMTGGLSSTLTFRYDAANGTYTVQDAAHSVTVGAGDRQGDAAYNNVYLKGDGVVTDKLVLYGNVRSDTAGTAPVTLSYTSFGLWSHIDTTANLTTRSYFLYGQPTSPADMPTTGTASYQMKVSAQIFGTTFAPSTWTTTTGDATLNANFGTGTVQTALTISGGGSYVGNGTIASNAFSGSFTALDPTFVSGQFSGDFFGPKAKEAGYTFQISKHSSDPYAGAAISTLDTYISGVAVGPALAPAAAPASAAAAPAHIAAPIPAGASMTAARGPRS